MHTVPAVPEGETIQTEDTRETRIDETHMTQRAHVIDTLETRVLGVLIEVMASTLTTEAALSMRES